VQLSFDAGLMAELVALVEERIEALRAEMPPPTAAAP
jgi:hypothetical protein